MRRVLIVGWPSFIEGVATAGDVLAMEAVARSLEAAAVPCDTAWSPVFRPGGLSLEDAAPSGYTHLFFVCGPVHGPHVEELHRRYAHCRRVAGGAKVSAQARAWDWPAVLTVPLDPGELERQWAWCLSAEGRAAARERAGQPASSLLDEALRAIS